ncbi:hypothetical protein TpMuguga_04g00834 [Theileria parva strain Muguga]|uniref:Uncharacterized protein n=1 Tax=Theileria parva TaxID=5875 RepID=Q4N1B2_THEPA|nr:uncharacterized protein TpMuguga_04g00834 [Theileria parva strain Muguga]EAN32188.1 hypothetical protein TpMuguga_04g00834 [Theileria parva strain Muguga]|eukprot:XP_764471.1 hypothetical protein [Theileria parva strain Muguga]
MARVQYGGIEITFVSLNNYQNCEKKMLYSEWIVEDIKWCMENGLLRNTTNTLCGISQVKTHSRSEIKLIFSNLLNQLIESKLYNKDVKRIEINVPVDKLIAEAQKESTISKSLEILVKTLRNLINHFHARSCSGTDFFYSFLCDLISMRRFNENNFKNTLERLFDRELLTKKEYFMIKIFVTLVVKILKLAAQNVNNTKKVNLKIDGKWTDSILIDNELINLLNYGSASGIYSRLRELTLENLENAIDPEGKNISDFNTVKSTLMCELGKLTKILYHLSKLILKDEEFVYLHVLPGNENMLNILLWNLITESIIESEIRTLYYDHVNLMKNLYKLKNRGFNVYRLFIILKYAESSNDTLEDLEKAKLSLINQRCNGKSEFKGGTKNLWRFVDLTGGVK